MRQKQTFNEWFTRRINPERIIFWTFFGVIAIGSILLKFPMSGTRHIPWIDAIFMSASAVCVTGLSVIDVGKDLTFPGQVILLALIQIGGLGIITFSLFFSLLLRIRTSVTSRLSVASLSRKIDTQNLLRSLGLVLVGTFCLEAIGAILLFIRLHKLHSLPEAIFSSIFHSVSAFCNCGLSIYPDNLLRFQHEFLVPTVMMTLIVLGGIGFIVIIEIHDWLRTCDKRKFHFSLHSKMCILGTLLFILIGADLFLLLERSHALAGMTLPQQLVNSFFLSVTPRTAGFNTIDTAGLTNASLMVTIIFMFIGGCPGSTAGGIKITTFLVLFALIRGKLIQSSMAYVLKRKVPAEVVDKSLAIFGSALGILIVATFILQITENLAWIASAAGRSFLDLLFEATSALGTVGLSTGVTTKLTVGGKIVLIVLMFLGRIGPITLGIALLPKAKKSAHFEYPEEDIMIG